MPNILYVSPHLDDAFLSCGTQIAQQAAGRNKVTVATIFTEGNSDSNHDLRRKNDMEVMEKAGVAFKHLGFTDAPFRDPKYNSFSSIMFHSEYPEDNELVQTLNKVIIKTIQDHEIDICYFPLGIGGHVDHNIAFHCGFLLLELPFCECIFYEDVPYNLVLNWAAIRIMQKFNTLITVDPETKLLEEQGHHFLQNYMTSRTDIMLSERLYGNELLLLEDFESEYLFTAKRTAHPVIKDEKLKLLSLYETEFETLFGDQKRDILHEEIFWKFVQNKI